MDIASTHLHHRQNFMMKGVQNMTEKHIEQHLVKAVKAKDGIAPKFVSPGYDGVPDRLLLLPGGKRAFCELKATGKKLRPIQARRKAQLERLGFSVYIIDDISQITPTLTQILMGGDRI